MGSFVLFYKTRNCLSATKTKQRKNCFDVLLIQVSFETNQLNLKQFFLRSVVCFVCTLECLTVVAKIFENLKSNLEMQKPMIKFMGRIFCPPYNSIRTASFFSFFFGFHKRIISLASCSNRIYQMLIRPFSVKFGSNFYETFL